MTYSNPDVNVYWTKVHFRAKINAYFQRVPVKQSEYFEYWFSMFSFAQNQSVKWAKRVAGFIFSFNQLTTRIVCTTLILYTVTKSVYNMIFFFLQGQGSNFISYELYF